MNIKYTIEIYDKNCLLKTLDIEQYEYFDLKKYTVRICCDFYGHTKYKNSMIIFLNNNKFLITILWSNVIYIIFEWYLKSGYYVSSKHIQKIKNTLKKIIFNKFENKKIIHWFKKYGIKTKNKYFKGYKKN